MRAHHLGGQVHLGFDRHFGERLPGAAQHPFFLGGAQHGIDLGLAEALGNFGEHVPHPITVEIVQGFELIMGGARQVLGFVQAAGIDGVDGQQVAWLAQRLGIVGA